MRRSKSRQKFRSRLHRRITTAVACLADITTDNPNVWFELGVAIASKRLVVIICSKERVRFPFDVQHFSIIPYATDSSSDFDKLREDIALRLKTLLEKEHLALHSLIEKRMVETTRDSDYNGNEFFAYRLTNAGVGWLSANQDKLPLRSTRTEESDTGPDFTDQDLIPF